MTDYTKMFIAIIVLLVVLQQRYLGQINYNTCQPLMSAIVKIQRSHRGIVHRVVYDCMYVCLSVGRISRRSLKTKR